jgi:SAM-dependent methyltransferase
MTPINYQDNFHNIHFQNSLNSAKEVVPLFLSYFKPQNVLDVGCGLGTWLNVFKENKCDVYGIDGDYVQKKDLIIDQNEFKDYDLNLQFDLQRKFELVISLEVAEHILPENAKQFIDSVCIHGDVILFSAAIPGQEGTLHYNEQYNEYWVDLFLQNDYECFDFLRHIIWNNNKISWWYRQNILIFVKKNHISNPIYKLITKENNYQNSYIHPELFEYKCIKADKFDKLEKLLNSPSELLKYYLKRLKAKIK